MIYYGVLKMLLLFADSLDSPDIVIMLLWVWFGLCIHFKFSDATAQAGGTFSAGSGPIWGGSVLCTGEEGRLVDCTFNSDTSGCSHSNDAGATCSVVCK